MEEIEPWNVGDNRTYVYKAFETVRRPEYKLVMGLIPRGSSVVDLGCGGGALAQLLVEKKKCKVIGVEIAPSGVELTKKKGIEAHCAPIDQGLPMFKDQQFEYSLCNVTLQMVMYPEKLISEMKRISEYQVISFPNFGVWKNRMFLMLKGRMPQATLYGYKWYSTGHIHQFSFADFKDLLAEQGLEVIELKYVQRRWWKNFLIRLLPNLFADVLVVKTQAVVTQQHLN